MALLMLFIRINKINWLQLYENSVMVKNQRMSSPSRDLAPLSLHPPWSHYPDSPRLRPCRGPGMSCRWAKLKNKKNREVVRRRGPRASLSWLVIINRRAFVPRVCCGGMRFVWVSMHEIAFQADKRSAQRSVRADRSFFFMKPYCLR